MYMYITTCNMIRLPQYHSLDFARAVKKLPVIKAEHGIHLRALVDIPAGDAGPAHKSGDEWQLKGPLTYIPRPAEIVKTDSHFM